MKVQTFLRGGGTLADLATKFAVKNTRHPKYQNLVLLKYHQIESPFAEPIVRECRGLILDETDNWAVVSRSFDKFFNHGEGHAASIDWSTARVQEKLDGSLCVLYYYDGVWHVQTSGMPGADGEVNGLGYSFASLFWKVFEAMKFPLPLAANADLCWAFELTTPWNRVVVPHKEERLTLLAVRNRVTGIESWNVAPYPAVRSFPLQSIEDVTATFSALNPMEQEGYVIVDAACNRIKVKHPGYVAIHHLRDGFGPRRLVEIIRSGEAPELLTYYPEWKPKFEEIQVRYDALVAEIEADYAHLKGIETQKDFAIEAVKTKCSGALFRLRKGQCASVKAHLADIVVKNLMEMLRVKDEEVAAE